MQRDTDLAKRITRVMQAQGKIPEPLTRLRTCLRQRVGLRHGE